MGVPTETIPYLERPSYTWKELNTARFQFNQPFKLEMPNAQFLYVDEIIRLVPRRRMIAFGVWQGKPIVAKLFFNPKRMKGHMQKEVNGVALLTKNNIPTPQLYYYGPNKDEKIHLLIFERIINAVSPDDVWRAKDTVEEVYPLLQKIIYELATQHVLGVLQRDLHMKNFLLDGENLLTIDTAEMDEYPPLLSKAISMQNLAQFFSQLGLEVDAFRDDLFRYYANARGWLLKQQDFDQLALLQRKTYEKRWQRYHRKIFRESTNTSCINTWRHFGMLMRVHATPELLQLVKNPDDFFQHPSCIFLKKGHSSTVAKLVIDDRVLVVKRYNTKNVWHFLRRVLRPTRALINWRLAHKLSLYGVASVKPICFLEKRYFGLKGRSYFISEHIAGDHAGNYFKQPREAKKIQSMVQKISYLLKNLLQAEVTHGDLKITNILVNEKEHPVLIDLDGACEHHSIATMRRIWRKEIKRFLRNFNQQPVLEKMFADYLQK